MVLYYILLPLAWIVFHIGFRVECIGRENLKKVRTSGCIIAPNHVSAIDPVWSSPGSGGGGWWSLPRRNCLRSTCC